MDPGNSQIKVWINPLFERGLLEGDLELSDAEPGIWTILAEADGEVRLRCTTKTLNHIKLLQLASKSFEVRKDTRPIFEILITTPTQTVSYHDGCIIFKIKVQVLVKSSIIGSSGFTGTLNIVCDQKGVVKFHRNLRVEDETILEIDFKHDLQLTEISDSRSFNLFVDYIDDATNKTFCATTGFTVEMSEYAINIVHSPQFFKPGIPYRFTILVTKSNGYPVLNSQAPVEVVVKDDDEFILLRGNFSLNPNTGGVEIELVGNSITAKTLFIKVKYARVKYSHVVHKAPTKKMQYVALNVLTPRWVTKKLFD